MTWEDVSLAEVTDRSLEVIVADQDRLGAHEQLGVVRLNLGTGNIIANIIFFKENKDRDKKEDLYKKTEYFLSSFESAKIL